MTIGSKRTGNPGAIVTQAIEMAGGRYWTRTSDPGGVNTPRRRAINDLACRLAQSSRESARSVLSRFTGKVHSEPLTPVQTGGDGMTDARKLLIAVLLCAVVGAAFGLHVAKHGRSLPVEAGPMPPGDLP